jgi:hypothetical protein
VRVFGQRGAGLLPRLISVAAFVSAGAKIPIVPVEKSATPKGSEAGLILETEEGRMCLGGETWMKWWD